MVSLMLLPDSRADCNCSVASLAFCWWLMNADNAAPATVRAMPHGPPSRLITLLPTALKPAVFNLALPAEVPKALICSEALIEDALNIWNAVCADAKAVLTRWIGSMARPMLLAMVLVLPLRLPAALCTAPNTPANDAMTTRVCCAPDGKPANASTRVSKPCTILRKGP